MESLMRLFTGLDLPSAVAANLERVQARLRPTARIHWSPVANLHVTTKFIGEWPEERVGELKDALAGIPGREPIRIAIRRLGFFPNPNAPRVFWCGIDAPGLRELAADTERVAGALGIAREEREYSPHLTLARIKERGNFQRLRDAIAALDTVEFGDFTADRVFLYHSRLTPAGSVYTKLAEFPFATK
jgi:RNA 2',3'-cyclic 3'-phosphodiesterase